MTSEDWKVTYTLLSIVLYADFVHICWRNYRVITHLRATIITRNFATLADNSVKELNVSPNCNPMTSVTRINRQILFCCI
jgi:hypothetical protein